VRIPCSVLDATFWSIGNDKRRSGVRCFQHYWHRVLSQEFVLIHQSCLFILSHFSFHLLHLVDKVTLNRALWSISRKTFDVLGSCQSRNLDWVLLLKLIHVVCKHFGCLGLDLSCKVAFLSKMRSCLPPHQGLRLFQIKMLLLLWREYLFTSRLKLLTLSFILIESHHWLGDYLHLACWEHIRLSLSLLSHYLALNLIIAA
jgi:hypothetical protein